MALRGGADGDHRRGHPAGWPDRIGIAHSVVAGILVHGIYLGGTAVAISHSIPAGLSALIPGLQPILTSTIANRWLGERVTPMQWAGLLLGLAGVVLILHDRPMSGAGRLGLVRLGRIAGQHHARHALPAALLQRDRLALRQSRAIHRGDGLLRTRRLAVRDATSCTGPPSSSWRSAWLAVVLSIGSIGLLYWLIRRSAATSVASLFYLVPAVTALMAYRAVRRAARCHRDCRHDRLCRCRAAGQSQRAREVLIAADRRVGRERAFAPNLVIDDRLRIGLAEFDARACEFERRRRPGLMNQLIGQLRLAPAPSA